MLAQYKSMYELKFALSFQCSWQQNSLVRWPPRRGGAACVWQGSCRPRGKAMKYRPCPSWRPPSPRSPRYPPAKLRLIFSM